MIEFITESYQGLICYILYISLFWYCLLYIYRRLFFLYPDYHTGENLNPFCLKNVPVRKRITNDRGFFFLFWLPKTIRRKDSPEDDTPGLFFFKTSHE